MDVTKLSDNELVLRTFELQQEMYDKMNDPADGYQPFGWDWPTFRVTYPELATSLEEARAEGKRRGLEKKPFTIMWGIRAPNGEYYAPRPGSAVFYVGRDRARRVARKLLTAAQWTVVPVLLASSLDSPATNKPNNKPK